ncbi:unnamed protein product [Soboliphyme baturini]|uniref:MFS domain-containing protein n=1 Tax=Soboliphyme baturini TaxID=241478 RepID=A0A183JBB1_9BILA|nr:unnamed protein product [Soboliphyme baturini]
MSNFLVDGTLYNVGQVFQPIWTNYFETSQSKCSWVLAIMVSWYYLAGPIIGCIINIFGCRVAGLIGVAIACLGLLLSIFAPSIYVMYFTFGFIVGE